MILIQKNRKWGFLSGLSYDQALIFYLQLGYLTMCQFLFIYPELLEQYF